MESGSMIRFMGRFCMDSSPVTVTSKFCADRIPDMRRVVVPLLPQSRMESGFFKPLRPLPRTMTESPLFSMATPIF